jgi:hypothetical protein
VQKHSFANIPRPYVPGEKSMKSPKGYSDAAVSRTDNTVAKGKTTKEQAMIYKTLHRKLTIEQHELH